MKVLLLQSQTQELMRQTPKVLTMSAYPGGAKDLGRGMRGGKGIVLTGFALHDHHAKAAGKVEASGKISTGIRGAVVAIATCQVGVLGKAGMTKVRLARILLATRGRIGSKSHGGKPSEWCNVMPQKTMREQVWQPNSVQAVSRLRFWALFLHGQYFSSAFVDVVH